MNRMAMAVTYIWSLAPLPLSIDSDGGTTESRFVEHYECPCGATGTVRGDAAAPPTEWTRTGRVFE